MSVQGGVKAVVAGGPGYVLFVGCTVVALSLIFIAGSHSNFKRQRSVGTGSVEEKKMPGC